MTDEELEKIISVMERGMADLIPRVKELAALICGNDQPAALNHEPSNDPQHIE
jgi:hypothetical protein